jgi:hypothetical protein
MAKKLSRLNSRKPSTPRGARGPVWQRRRGALDWYDILRWPQQPAEFDRIQRTP